MEIELGNPQVIREWHWQDVSEEQIKIIAKGISKYRKNKAATSEIDVILACLNYDPDPTIRDRLSDSSIARIREAFHVMFGRNCSLLSKRAVNRHRYPSDEKAKEIPTLLRELWDIEGLPRGQRGLGK
jgi:hypothetical protein